MKTNKWIIIGVIVLVLALAAAVIGVNMWFQSGNVRVMGGQLRVDFSGVGYIFSHETGEIIGQAPLNVSGKTSATDKELFVGDLEILGYMNEADGTLLSNKAVREGDDGYWEIYQMESCRHVEEDEDGNTDVVSHACKYSYIYYVHPDQQDFLVIRVKDKYAMFPFYVVLASSEEEATEIYKSFTEGKF